MRTGTMIRRTLAITAAVGLVLALSAAAVSAVPVDRSREPARATVQPVYRIAKHAERRAMNRAKGLPPRRARFAWRIGRARPRLGFVCIKRGTYVYGIGVRRRAASTTRWRTWTIHANAAQSYGQHCAQIFRIRAG
jgi:hypothetical protein